MNFPPMLPGASLIGDEELAEIRDVITSRSPFRFYGIGEPNKVATLEREARHFLGCSYALGVNSGSSALFCAVVASGVSAGDEVVLPAFSWFSDYTSVLLNGGIPVFADIDESLNIDPDDFRRKITPRTKAVIVVHYQGGPASLEEILEVAKKHQIVVIEDCAQAFGGEFRGKKLGTHGDIGVTSFQGNKMITAGEGGLVYTDDETMFVRAVRCHDNGSMRDYFSGQLSDASHVSGFSPFPGMQFRMSELQGAMLVAQLRKLPGLLSTCRRHHERLRTRFAETDSFEFRRHVEGDCGITLFFRLADEEAAKEFGTLLAEAGVPVGPSSGCVNVLHDEMIQTRSQLHDAFPPAAGTKIEPYDPSVDAKRTDSILARFVAVGIGPLYTDEHIDFISNAIKTVLDRAVQPAYTAR